LGTFYELTPSFTVYVLGLLNVKLREGGNRVNCPDFVELEFINTDYREHSELRIRPYTIKSVRKTIGDYCVPGNAVPTVKMTTPFPGVPALETIRAGWDAFNPLTGTNFVRQ